MDAALTSQLKNDHEKLIGFLNKNKFSLPEMPKVQPSGTNEGETFALAYPIQGLLKYHGMSDSVKRTAYFPSISLCNDAFFTVSYLKLDPTLTKDEYVINGIAIKGEEYNRIQNTLNEIRDVVHCKANVQLISRNVNHSNNAAVIGKGIGTSASAGAAMTHGLMHLLYNQVPSIDQNRRLLSILARSFAGSAARSAVGGIGLWFSYPKIPSNESFAMRIDESSNQEFIRSISLITFEIPSQIRTQQAHNIVTQSPFFNEWAKLRKNRCIDFINALKSQDFEMMGKLTEYDTLCLHAVTMTADIDHALLLWSPTTMELIQFTRTLREDGIPVFFSIDTGPSIVLLTLKKMEDRVLHAFREKYPDLTPSIGGIGGPSEILTSKSPLIKPLLHDIETNERR